MPRALCTIRDLPHYRREAFVTGLEKCGFDVVSAAPKIEPGDICVVWNRYGRFEAEAQRFEAKGAKVIVAENGYCGEDSEGRQTYALALGNHLGVGRFFNGDASRWDALGIELKPWQERDGGHILLCPSRGIGPKGIAQPAGWARSVTQVIQRHSKRPIVLREHPGTDKSGRPFSEDLAHAYCVVIWASRCGVEALIEGVPVFYGLPGWILGSIAQNDLSRIETPKRINRRPAFERLAWAQWKVDEIASGEPFRCLLSL